MGYPWPASRLTRADMIRLTELRSATRRPITLLLHEAVSALFEQLTSSAPDEDAAREPFRQPLSEEAPRINS